MYKVLPNELCNKLFLYFFISDYDILVVFLITSKTKRKMHEGAKNNTTNETGEHIKISSAGSKRKVRLFAHFIFSNINNSSIFTASVFETGPLMV